MYQCPEDMDMTRIERPYIGTYFFVSGVFLMIVYLPCFIAMIISKHRSPSFQLMMMLGVFDLLSLFINSITTGYLGFIGASYCHYPLVIFFVGAFAFGGWMGCCSCCILLAVDRCAEINPQFLFGIIFHKKVFPLVKFIVLALSIYVTFFTNPVLFTAKYNSWFFDPNIGKEANLYYNIPQTINNLLVALLSTALYIYLCYHLIFKFGYTTSMWMYKTKQQIIIQAVILCSFHAIAAYIYVYMQFFPSPPWLIIIGQIAWQWSNGCVCIVYWTLNRTVRNAAIRMMLPRSIREKYGLAMGIDEQIAMERRDESTNPKNVGTAISAAVNSAKIAPFLKE
ncbi:Serpentine Receptor, class T [Caenorhabditis elegans]|uniref:Serpentine Receptor, class T n=1 Tax=Caenorhabditis elegans TaxID=6239 RepID=Q23073_CAEEL|nr:Serpentine Receptor, class T [Caenorhabditis elegans]CCD68661.1 Serpentine Receptor, class T [Caenorhabditis elegans]|eukprot:NP_504174.2 Serpentine Receptor, class T [Caenorhabditis elegans]